MRLSLLVSVVALVLSIGMATASYAGPGLGDSDGDSIDDFFDNCTDDVNASQTDSDFDGCGNLCDGDFDQDAATNGGDFLIFRAGFIAGASGVTDMDSDGTTNGGDFLIFRSQFIQGVPGPSLNTFRDTAVCP